MDSPEETLNRLPLSGEKQENVSLGLAPSRSRTWHHELPLLHFLPPSPITSIVLLLLEMARVFFFTFAPLRFLQEDPRRDRGSGGVGGGFGSRFEPRKKDPLTDPDIETIVPVKEGEKARFFVLRSLNHDNLAVSLLFSCFVVLPLFIWCSER